MRRLFNLLLILIVAVANTAAIGNYGAAMLIPKPASGPTCTMSGGTQTTSGGREIHTFSSTANLTVTGTCTGVRILIVASAGSVGACTGGPQGSFSPSGAGGVVYYGTESPAAAGEQTLAAGTYTATVAAGVAAGGSNADGNQGNDSSFTGLTTALGGGKGRISNLAGANGGSASGGGGGGAPGAGGTGTTGQGHNGGAGSSGTRFTAGSAGGCSAAGVNGTALGNDAGGAACSYSISGASVAYGKGGNSPNLVDSDAVAGTNPGDGVQSAGCNGTTHAGAASVNGIIIVSKPL